MRAVVTGGAGFLGSHLCDRLIAEGWDVLALDNLITGVDANIAHLQRHPRFRIARGDVSNYIDVAGPVDYVLHFASPASPVVTSDPQPGQRGVCDLGERTLDRRPQLFVLTNEVDAQ